MSSARAVVQHGQPCVCIALPGGDQATVALHGAQVLSWTTVDGVERLFLSPRAVFDGRTAIRGGVPVCFPQFNQRGPLPKHGFARNLPWTPSSPGPEAAPGDGVQAAFELQDSAATRGLWPHGFLARLTVTLQPGRLGITFTAHNTGAEPWDFTLALHSYLRTGDITTSRLHGLGGAAVWDAVRDRRHAAEPARAAEPLSFDGETDRVYTARRAPLRLAEPRGTLEITQDACFPETVVWNPGEALCATLADMPADGWRHMLCVEAAAIDTPVRLAPGERWSGTQTLAVAAA
ncbi:MAG: D-hexose-6-phosphate mutarotase [Pseudomonadota bacterium]